MTKKSKFYLIKPRIVENIGPALVDDARSGDRRGEPPHLPESPRRTCELPHSSLLLETVGTCELPQRWRSSPLVCRFRRFYRPGDLQTVEEGKTGSLGEGSGLQTRGGD